MLYGLMLASGNDAAVAIAEHIGGSVPQFVRMMNARAAGWARPAPIFSNPNGLPDDTHMRRPTIWRGLPARRWQRGVSADRFHPVGAKSVGGRTYSRQLTNKTRLLETYPGARRALKRGSPAARALSGLRREPGRDGAGRRGAELFGLV